MRKLTNQTAGGAGGDAWAFGVATVRAIETRSEAAPAMAAAAHEILAGARRLRAAGLIPLPPGDVLADACWIEENLLHLVERKLLSERAANLYLDCPLCVSRTLN
ncbi:MAG: hypothetical protein EPN36_12140 [Rhodanobacteraceae bacterium]|nr:MAG: hypothetical protein EPN36_12140 [Rhodanobacteraceae bacterium]